MSRDYWFGMTPVRSYTPPKKFAGVNQLKSLVEKEKRILTEEESLSQFPTKIEKFAELGYTTLFKKGNRLYSFSHIGKKSSITRKMIKDEFDYVTFDLGYLEIDIPAEGQYSLCKDAKFPPYRGGAPRVDGQDGVVFKVGKFYHMIYFDLLSPGKYLTRKFYSPYDLTPVMGDLCHCDGKNNRCTLLKDGGEAWISHQMLSHVVKVPDIETTFKAEYLGKYVEVKVDFT